MIDVQGPDLEALARSAPVGSVIRMRNVPLETGTPPVSLALERFTVFAADARITVHGVAGARRLRPPANAYFRGYVEGDPTARALLTVRERGGVRGLVVGAGSSWVLGAGPGAAAPATGLAGRRVMAGELAAQTTPFRCGAERLPPIEAAVGAVSESLPTAAVPAAQQAGPAGATYTATVAVETDFEYYQLFGDAQDATDYVGDLFAYASTIYGSEVDTALEVGSLTLWETENDPWVQASAGCSLYEFGRYWNDNRGDESRALAHFLSGRSFGGVAFVGVLCREAFSVSHGGSCPGLSPDFDNYGGAYGISGGLSGGFDLQNPQILWDIYVVAHELGHNFRSPHTHCYGGLGGEGEPVDGCYVGECGSPGCACGESALPGGCSGPGQSCGTVMSYCHLESGGMSNVALSLGAGHDFGLAPDRVPSRMLSHVQQADSLYPGCLTPVNVPPFAADDSWSTGEGIQLTLPAPGVLANDGDADGDPVTAELVSGPSGGSLSLDPDGSFVYTPAAGFFGTDSFLYRAHDGIAGSATATVQIEVEECQGDTHLALSNETITGPETYQACETITVGPDFRVEPSGDVALEAGLWIVLGDGFEVEGGGTMRAVNAP